MFFEASGVTSSGCSCTMNGAEAIEENFSLSASGAAGTSLPLHQYPYYL